MGRERSKSGCKKKQPVEEPSRRRQFINMAMELAALCVVAIMVDVCMDLVYQRTYQYTDRITVTYMLLSSNLVLTILYTGMLKFMGIFKMILISVLLSLSALMLVERPIEQAFVKEAILIAVPLNFAKLLTFRILIEVHQLSKDRGFFKPKS